MADYHRLLRVARGEEPADVVIRNGTLLNVITRDVYPATVGICEDTIAYVTGPDDDALRGAAGHRRGGDVACAGSDRQPHAHREHARHARPFCRRGAAARCDHGCAGPARDGERAGLGRRGLYAPGVARVAAASANLRADVRACRTRASKQVARYSPRTRYLPFWTVVMMTSSVWRR